METYPVDLDAGQIVQWLIEEQRRRTLHLKVLATRSYVVEDMDESEVQNLGEEAENFSDILTIGILEISPPTAKGGWVLRVRVEDRIGPRLPDDEDAPDGDEEIDLETFQGEFIVPERGLTEVLLDAADAHAKAQFARVFKNMLNDKHQPAGRR